MRLGLVVLLAMATGFAPQLPPSPGQQRAPARTGTSRIRGRVVSAETGRALARATVQLTSPDLAEPRTAVTDTLGRYDFRNLPSGSYLLTAFKPTYLAAPFGGRLPTDAGTSVKVAEADTASNIDIRLFRAASISGRVVDDQGEPVPYVGIRVLKSQYLGGVRRLTVLPGIIDCKTDDLGQYRLFDLASGTYYIVATPSEASGTDAGDGSGYAPTFHPGFVDPAQSRAVHVEPGQDEPNVDVALAPTRTTRVVGTALDLTGRPSAGGSVSAVLMGAGGAGLDVSGVSIRPENGSFVFRSLPPGDYLFTAVMRSTGFGRPSLDIGRARLAVVGGEVVTLNIQANPGGRFAGRVVFEGATPTTAPPIRGMSVSPVGIDPVDAVPAGSAPADRQVRADGGFGLTGLFGQLLFRVEGVPPGWTVKSISIGGRDVTDAPVWFEGREQYAGVQVLLTSKVTKVLGKVLGEDGNPVQVAYVFVLSSDPSRWSSFSRHRGSAVVRDASPFNIDALPPGDYFAIAFAENPSGLDAGDPETVERLRRSGVAFSLEEGQTKTFTLTIR